MTNRNPNVYEAFLDKLHCESLAGYLEMQQLRYALAVKLKLNEADALELAVAILAAQTGRRRTDRSYQTPPEKELIPA